MKIPGVRFIDFSHCTANPFELVVNLVLIIYRNEILQSCNDFS